MRLLVHPYSLGGKLVTFYGYEGRLPRDARKVGEVQRNGHTFYETKDGTIYMESCVGDYFEIVDYRKPSGIPWETTFEDVSEDFEGLDDPISEWERNCKR